MQCEGRGRRSALNRLLCRAACSGDACSCRGRLFLQALCSRGLGADSGDGCSACSGYCSQRQFGSGSKHKRESAIVVVQQPNGVSVR